MSDPTTSVVDTSDRRLLSQLERDSRESAAALGRKLHMAEETVRYRIARLRDVGVIKNFHAVVDTLRLGVIHYKLMVRCIGVPITQMSAIATNLLRRTSMRWIAQYEGAYDLEMSLQLSNQRELIEFSDTVTRAFGKSRIELAFASVIDRTYFPRDYLVSQDSPRARTALRQSVRALPEAVDEVDRAILQALERDARMSAPRIGEVLRERKIARTLTPEAIGLRIRRLERRMLIAGYGLHLDPEAIGFVHCKVMLHLAQHTEKTYDSLRASLSKLPNVIYVARTIGAWDFEIHLEAENARDLRKAIDRVREEHWQVIKDFVSLRMYHIADRD